jgi:hypothetical protein
MVRTKLEVKAVIKIIEVKGGDKWFINKKSLISVI